ncbi:hypothetical protein CJF31_00007014 [Rutstroemia sp. NJR-2017a BVV2]|nr:hypothetical protein CJF31_00007014 [Rutstroemia sp. NJR-2017a BVV2]
MYAHRQLTATPVCTSLLLATTYQLSSLPTRQSSLDHSIILPLSSTIPLSSRFRSPSASPSPAPPSAESSSSTQRNAETQDSMQGLERTQQPSPAEEPEESTAPPYTSFTSPHPIISTKPLIIRRQGEDGFEKRSVYRCARCTVVIGYEIVSESEMGGKAQDEDERVLYILPGALMSTDVMRSEKKVVREEEVEGVLRGEGVTVYD